MDNGSMPQPGLAVWPRAESYLPAGAKGWSTHHCRMLESMGLEKMGEGLGNRGVGLEPFYLQEGNHTGRTPKQTH